MIFVISGPGGVGKGAVVSGVLRRLPGISLSRSWTTRPPRPGEPPDAYVFVDRQTFEARVAEGGFLEWTRFPGTGHFYGTPAVDPANLEKDLVLEIELDGAQQVKRRYPEAVLIFVKAPTLEDQLVRLRGRGDDESSVARRLEVGKAELELGERIADFVVVNDDLERAVAEVAGIIESCRSQARQDPVDSPSKGPASAGPEPSPGKPRATTHQRGNMP